MSDTFFTDFSNTDALTPDGNGAIPASHVGQYTIQNATGTDTVADIALQSGVSDPTHSLLIGALADDDQRILRAANADGSTLFVPAAAGLGVYADLLLPENPSQVAFGFGVSDKQDIAGVIGLHCYMDVVSSTRKGQIDLLDGRASGNTGTVQQMVGPIASIAEDANGNATYDRAYRSLSLAAFINEEINSTLFRIEYWIKVNQVLQSSAREEWVHVGRRNINPNNQEVGLHLGVRNLTDNIDGQVFVSRLGMGSSLSLTENYYDPARESSHYSYYTNNPEVVNNDLCDAAVTEVHESTGNQVSIAFTSDAKDSVNGSIRHYLRTPGQVVPEEQDRIGVPSGGIGYHDCNMAMDNQGTILAFSAKTESLTSRPIAIWVSTDGGETFSSEIVLPTPAPYTGVAVNSRGIRTSNGWWLICQHAVNDRKMIVYKSSVNTPTSVSDWSSQVFDYTTLVESPVVAQKLDESLLFLASSTDGGYLRYLTGAIDSNGLITTDTADWLLADGNSSRPYFPNGGDEVDLVRASGDDDIYLSAVPRNEDRRNQLQIHRLIGGDLADREQVAGYSTRGFFQRSHLFLDDNDIGVSYSMSGLTASYTEKAARTAIESTDAVTSAELTAAKNEIMSAVNDNALPTPYALNFQRAMEVLIDGILSPSVGGGTGKEVVKKLDATNDSFTVTTDRDGNRISVTIES